MNNETRDMRQSREREQYWAAKRMAASTAKELDYARSMESKAASAYEQACREATAKQP